ncbi:NeuD/PglB/VioB family sugar acetyltransferase [Verrucomicrobia bacterium]|nr:NeuD/PglB/VioB family sugar acetyltransferase [Verrucomicrobiota bacterium]
MKSNNYIEVSLSQVGVNENSAILQEWLVKEGQYISIGAIICAVETTKIAIEIEAENEGYIVPIAEECSEVNFGDTIAVIVADKEYIAKAKSEYSSLNPANAVDNKDNVKVTKKAKELIEKHSIDINSMPQDKGIIRTEDVVSVIREHEGISDNCELPIDLGLKALIIYGASKGAVTLCETIGIESTYNVVCFVDDNKSHKNSLLGLPVFHSSELSTLKNKGIQFIACEIANGKSRLRIKNTVEELGYELVNVIHPKTHISKSTKIGKGNYIKSAAVLETNTTIGDCCIIDNGSVIAHDNRIGNGCHVAPGVSLGSSISIGDFCVIGIGASISTNVKIGKNCIISVGSSVTKDVPDNSIVEGVPGKVIGTVKK